MNAEISIARRDIYTSEGEFDTSLFEMRIAEDDDVIQLLCLDDARSIVHLRDVLNHYIEANNLEQQY